MQRTRRVSQSRGGRDTDGPSYHPAISGDGRFVAFVSEASNLTHDGSKRVAQIYLRDMETGATELISRAPAGRPGDAACARPVVSGDGSVIAYQSLASNLLCDDKCGPSGRDINLLWDVYVYDRPVRRTIRASSGRREEWMESSRGPSLDDTGRLLAFMSTHPSSPGDEGHGEDLFILGLESQMSGKLTYRKFSISIRSEVVVLRWTRTVFPSGDTARRFGSKGALTLPRTRTRPVEGSST